MTKRSSKAKDFEKSTLLPLAVIPIGETPNVDDENMAAACLSTHTLAKQLLTSLSQLVKTCEQIQRVGVKAAFTKDDLAHRLNETIEQTQKNMPPLPASLLELTQLIESWRSNEVRTRRTRFENIADDLSWRIYGSWPEPVVERVAFVVVNDSTGLVTVNGQRVKGTPTAERIASSVAEELQSLRKAQVEPSEFISNLRKAFITAGGSPEKGVAVFDLLREMVLQRQSKAFQKDPKNELFKGYSVAQFRNDLTGLLATGAPRVREGNTEYELEIQGGSFASDGIFMYFPQTDRLATCGRLTFRPIGVEGKS